jgi:hypothetical protein
LSSKINFLSIPAKLKERVVFKYINIYGGLETAHHLFLSYPVFALLWSLVRTWVAFSLADSLLIRDHFIQFIHSAGGSSVRRSFLQLLWYIFGWCGMHERNSRVFKAKESTVHHMLEKVQVHFIW